MTTVSRDILDSCIKIHKTLGPDLLESVYRDCLCYELEQKGHKPRKEVSLPVTYDGLRFETGFRADIIVNEGIILEIKSVEKLMPIHKAQTLTYLKLANFPLGFLINFGEVLLKDGFHRFANGDKANDM